MAETPAGLGFRVPAEWEPHHATWIGWPHNASDWPGKFGSIPWVYGEIARALFTPANTLSAQLLVLANAGLIRARREGRSIIYAINFDAMGELLVFLTEDCCGGRAEMCALLAQATSRAT